MWRVREFRACRTLQLLVCAVSWTHGRWTADANLPSCLAPFVRVSNWKCEQGANDQVWSVIRRSDGVPCVIQHEHERSLPVGASADGVTDDQLDF